MPVLGIRLQMTVVCESGVQMEIPMTRRPRPIHNLSIRYGKTRWGVSTARVQYPFILYLSLDLHVLARDLQMVKFACDSLL